MENRPAQPEKDVINSRSFRNVPEAQVGTPHPVDRTYADSGNIFAVEAPNFGHQGVGLFPVERLQRLAQKPCRFASARSTKLTAGWTEPG